MSSSSLLQLAPPLFLSATLEQPRPTPSLTQALKQPPLRVPCLRFQDEPRPPMPLSSPPFCGHNDDPSTTQLGSCDTPCLGPSTDFVLSLVFYAFLGLVSALGLGLPVPPLTQPHKQLRASRRDQDLPCFCVFACDFPSWNQSSFLWIKIISSETQHKYHLYQEPFPD